MSSRPLPRRRPSVHVQAMQPSVRCTDRLPHHCVRIPWTLSGNYSVAGNFPGGETSGAFDLRAKRVVQLCHTRRMEQTAYRIAPQSIIHYGVEVTELGKAPQILLTCPTEDAAEVLDRRDQASAVRQASTVSKGAAHRCRAPANTLATRIRMILTIIAAPFEAEPIGHAARMQSAVM